MDKVKSFAIGAIVSVFVFCALIGYSARIGAKITANECDLMGRTMLNGKPYQCSALAEKEPTP